MQMVNNKLRVSTIQMHVTADRMVNLQNAIRLVRETVHTYKPHLVVLPENFTTLYGKQHFTENAEVIPGGETYTIMSQLAKELHIFLIAGSIPEMDKNNKSMLYNTSMVFSPEGIMLTKYRKMHLFDSEMTKTDATMPMMRQSEYMHAGMELGMFEIEGIKIGLGIGYDMSFAELAHLYRMKDVRMMVYVASFPTYLGYLQWTQLIRSRAFENQMFVVGAATVRDDMHKEFVSYAHSMMVDYRGHVLARTSDQEETIFAEFDFHFMDTYRQKINIWMHRRADVYDTKMMM